MTKTSQWQVEVRFANGAVATFGLHAQHSVQAYRKMYAHVMSFPRVRGAHVRLTRLEMPRERPRGASPEARSPVL